MTADGRAGDDDQPYVRTVDLQLPIRFQRMLLDENAGGRDESHTPSTLNVSVCNFSLPSSVAAKEASFIDHQQQVLTAAPEMSITSTKSNHGIDHGRE